VGSAVSLVLAEAGLEVVDFDIVDGNDVLDGSQLRAAMKGCDAVVHAAGLVEPVTGDPERLRVVNVEGTRQALDAATGLSVRCFVFVSSAAATGVFKGERLPDYLPLDEAHPSYAACQYSASKRDAEILCERAARSSGMTVVVLCPPGVWTAETYHRIVEARRREPRFEWSPFWEYGAFIDVRDLASACRAAVTSSLRGHSRMLVASSDVTTSGRTSLELVRDLMPNVPWRGDASYRSNPYQTLVRIDRARSLLGWEPRFTWQSFLS
jgi:nucleoside-diphosphate-sugar epimerase